MYLPILLVSSVLALLWRPATASPIQTSHLIDRAGAPIARPIPSSCSITYPLHSCEASSLSPTRYKLTKHANATLLYTYFLQPDSFQVRSSNASTLLQNCLQTCYGYGRVGDCKSVYQAYDYPMPPEFGLRGGNPVVACLMWNRTVTASDFQVVPAKTKGYGNSTAADIVCPT